MTLDAEACYRALTARDARFDGQFFTGVTTTGIFCRPVCPARTPGRANCIFYASAAAALEAGYRPCLRCRPEVSPDRPAWLGTSIVVGRALRLINEGALDEDGGGVEELAARVGLGERHLRRLFEEHLGASPVAVAQARRLLFAKRLLTETRLPLTEVALAAGFGSLRRFNDLFLRTYSRSPRLLRKEGPEAAPAAAGAIEFRLPYRPPYDWKGVSGFLGKRAIPGVEACDAATGYRRTVIVAGQPGRIHVAPIRGADALRLRLEVASVAELRQVVDRVARMFDLGAEPRAIRERLGKWGVPGVRIPGAWDPFELAVRAILGQQVTVAAAVTMAARIVERWGETAVGLPGSNGPNRLFPTPAVLARAEVAGIGLPRARADSITGLARLVDRGELDFSKLGSLEESVRTLCEVRGIGEWTAQYIAMRAFGEPDAFPAGDLALGKAAGVTDAELRTMAEAWRPWRAYAAFSLWQKGSQS